MDDKATGLELATEADRWELSDDGLCRRVGARGSKFIAMMCYPDNCTPSPTKHGIVVDIE